jgi:hypothetical protein
MGIKTEDLPTNIRQIRTGRSIGQFVLTVFATMVFFSFIFIIGYGMVIWVDGIQISGRLDAAWKRFPNQAKLLVQETGNCCGLRDIFDSPAFSETCPEGAVSAGGLTGCYLFLSRELSNQRRTCSAYVFTMAVAEILALLTTFILLNSPFV